MIRRPPRSPLFPSTPLSRSLYGLLQVRPPRLVGGVGVGEAFEHDGAHAEPGEDAARHEAGDPAAEDRKSTRLNSSHANISYAVFCLKKKKKISESLTNLIPE